MTTNDIFPIAFSPDRLTLITSDADYQDGFHDYEILGGKRIHLSADGWTRVSYEAGAHKGIAYVEAEDGSVQSYSIGIDLA